MSLINDALKRAKQSQPPNSPPGASPLPPVENKSGGGSGWTLILAVILFVIAIFFFAGSSFFKQKNAPAPTTNPSAPVKKKLSHQTNSMEASAVNTPVEVTGQLPKVQGIIYDVAHPMAIVDRKTVRVGDRDGDYKIVAISNTSVTFQRADGSLAEVKIGKQ